VSLGSEEIQRLWHMSHPFKGLIKSYLWIFMHPLLTLRLLNFAVRVMFVYEVYPDE